MMAPLLATVVIATTLIASQTLRAEPASPSLSTMIAGIQRLRDRIALGDAAALKAQAAALRSVSEAIDALSPEVWANEGERNAAAVYLLSGGSPRPLAKILESSLLSKEETTLLHGALAYALGRRQEAKSLLIRFDPRKIDPRVAGQLAYVQAELIHGEDRGRAIAALDFARLLAPGGLVEEAALRREILMLAEAHNGEKFALLARQYARRFSRSLYYDNFKKILFDGLERLSVAENFADIGHYFLLGAGLPTTERTKALLTLARGAVSSLHSQAAIALAEAARRDASRDGPDQAQAKLYKDAVCVLTEDNAECLRDLGTIPTALLDRQDAELLAVAGIAAAALRKEAVLSAIPTAIGVDHEDGSENATVDLAKAALLRADAAIAEMGRPTQ